MNVESLTVLTLAGLGALVLFVSIMVAGKRRKVVQSSSAALAELQQLNEHFRGKLTYPGPINYDWVDEAGSKGKFDRYDLNQFFLAQLASLEDEIQRQISRQENDVTVYAEYRGRYDRLGAVKLGRSRSDELSDEKYAVIERKLFTKRRLREPTCAARVRCTVRYTSPKGQNSYARQREWNFSELRQGLAQMRHIRAQQSTARFLRQQERNRMSARLRHEVLKRDGNRCRHCGASAQLHGVTLHVDHIHPVSRGGKTELENLQTLCDTCNLGKSDRI